MHLYLAALWFAVALNVCATIFQLYRARLYYKAYDEAQALLDKLRNTQAMMEEHVIR